MLETIDYNKYTLDELYQVLETIDDETYPLRATEIYSRLLTKLNLKPKEASTESLGYKNYNSNIWLMFINLPLLLDFYFLENDITEVQMREKIKRLNALIEDQTETET